MNDNIDKKSGMERIKRMAEKLTSEQRNTLCEELTSTAHGVYGREEILFFIINGIDKTIANLTERIGDIIYDVKTINIDYNQSSEGDKDDVIDDLQVLIRCLNAIEAAFSNMKDMLRV